MTGPSSAVADRRLTSILIRQLPEPLAGTQAAPETTAAHAESRELMRLVGELSRYCKAEISGRSFLIAGHRGAGKTTLVAAAVERATRAASGVRPLLVPLHGPSLLPRAEGDDAATDDLRGVLEQIVLGLHRALATHLAGEYRRRVVERVEALAKWEKNATSPRDARSRRRVTRFAERRRAELRDAFELAAQLELELFESPTPLRLNEYWRRGGFLPHGVGSGDTSSEWYYATWFADGVPARDALGDRGLRELVALVSASHAYQRISGTFTRRERLAESGRRRARAGWSADAARAVTLPLVSLVAGGLAGGALLTSTDGLLATLGGIATAAATAGTLRLSVDTERTRRMSWEQTFLPDLSRATLDRVIPLLIERTRAAGLAPVFVVDELDKVDAESGDLAKRLRRAVRHLKKLVAESAFFCFLTDRSYYEELLRLDASRVFAEEYTFYTHRLFVSYDMLALHRFLDSALFVAPEVVASTTSEANKIKDDAAVLPYILLHRSRAHTIDLHRELLLHRDAEGYVAPSLTVVRDGPAGWNDVRIQVAAEIVLDGRELRQRFERDPAFRRLAHDAVYYLSRTWREREQTVDLSDDALSRFEAYLRSRTGAERGGSRWTLELSEKDLALLFQAVRSLAEMLSNPEAFRARLEEHQNDWEGRTLDPPPYEGAIFDALQLDAAMPDSEGVVTVPLPLARTDGDAWQFRWVYDPAGNGDPEEIDPESRWRPYAAFAREFETFLRGLGAS